MPYAKVSLDKSSNTRVPQDCCQKCRYRAEWTGRDGVSVHSCSLRTNGYFTPDCAFGPKREAVRKLLAARMTPGEPQRMAARDA